MKVVAFEVRFHLVVGNSGPKHIQNGGAKI